MDKAPPAPYKRASGPLPSQQAAYKGDESATGNGSGSGALDKPVEKQKPTFAASGKLAAETNTVTGTTIVLKYNEPPEARKPAPSVDWRLFEFKGGEQIGKALQLGQRSCWLFGRERAVVDYPIEHPSCSKQHAVLQFRWVEKRDEFGERRGAVKPYVIDLDSANGTRVNGEAIEGRRFVEVRSGDVLAFGDSTREYVVLLSPPT
jgi:smad nuclear-interacting protein 1